MQREGDHDANLDVADEHAPNYLSWIADLCRPHLGPRVLEVGAGYGAITARYQHGRQVVANDVSPSCVNVLRQRFADTPTVRIDDRDLRSLPYRHRFDSVLMVNVLEHIPDDVAALAQLGRAVVPGRTIVVYVPALNGLYGPWDRQVGHYRRYSVWRLARGVQAGATAATRRGMGQPARDPGVGGVLARRRYRPPAERPAPCHCGIASPC